MREERGRGEERRDKRAGEKEYRERIDEQIKLVDISTPLWELLRDVLLSG